jgi:hypothetical protein
MRIYNDTRARNWDGQRVGGLRDRPMMDLILRRPDVEVVLADAI